MAPDPSIPDNIAAEADKAFDEQKESRRRLREAAREAAERDEDCRREVSAFLRATESLWLAEFSPPFDPHPHLKAVHEALLKSCETLSQTGQAVRWGQVDHDEVYSRFRDFQNRRLTRPSYDWAQHLFDCGSRSELPEGLVVQTWNKESLRDSLYWLRVFVCGLSGEGAVLSYKTQQSPPPDTPASREQPEPERGQRAKPTKTSNDTPRTLLTGWHVIANTLNMKYAERDQIKRLNQRFKGPIVNKGPGTKPMVYRDDLIAWWDGLAVQAQESENRREGARLSAEAQHNYGRDGNAAPEIGGGVKKRRRDKGT